MAVWGELYTHEQARELSITLLKEWLVKYKFKNWKKTETRGLNVTEAMKKQRAKEIATELNNTDKWHLHSRGIPMIVLQRDLKLRIDDFGADKELNKSLSLYYRLLTDYMMRRTHSGVIHADGTYIPLIGARP